MRPALSPNCPRTQGPNLSTVILGLVPRTPAEDQRAERWPPRPAAPPQSRYRSLTAPSRCRTRAAARTSSSISRALTPIRFTAGSLGLQWATQPQATQR